MLHDHLLFRPDICEYRSGCSDHHRQLGRSAGSACQPDRDLLGASTEGLPELVDDRFGDGLAAQVTIFNTLGENLSIHPSYAANPAIHSWAEYDYFCGGSNQMAMVGYALFQGYYSQENFSLAGQPMQLAPFVELPCANWPDPTSIVFLPHNDTAEVYGTGGGGIVEPISVPATTESCSTNGAATQCGEGTGLYGYWNTSAPLTFQQAAVGSPFFRYLPPGAYTIAAQDVWNQTVYAHFQVTQASAVTTTSTSQTTAQPLIEIATPSASTSNSSLGLRLVLQLSATGPSGGSLTIGLSAVNLLNSTRTVSYADDWAYPQGGLTENDYCAFPASLAFGVFSGNLSLGNYKDGNPLPLTNTNVQLSCTITLVPTSFAPLGNESVGQSLTGYWTGGINTPAPGVFVTFPSGVYTVIGVDEWGQLLLLHFVVPGAATTTSGSGGTTSTTSTTSSSPTSTLTTSTTSITAAASSPTTASGTAATTQLGPTVTGTNSSFSASYILLIMVAAAAMLSVALIRPRGAKKRGASV